MRLTPVTTLVTMGVTALSGALYMTTGATAAQQDAATGGGQVLVGSEGGPGSTIAFTARGTAEDAKGQVQYVNREQGTGQSQVVQHGTVECIDVTENTARISGVWRDGGTFGLYVQDNGEGSSGGGDIVTVVPDPNGCNFSKPDETWALARGNAQVRDAG